MLDQTSRPLKVLLMVLIVVVLAALVVLSLRDQAKTMPQAGTTNNNTLQSDSPGSAPVNQNSQTVEPAQPPVMNIERDPNAPPLVSPEDALKERGMQGGPAPDPAAPAPAPASAQPAAPPAQ